MIFGRLIRDVWLGGIWRMARPYWRPDTAWAQIEQHLPHGRPGRPRVDDRRVTSGILHVLATGCRWRDVPPAYGPAMTVYSRYHRWSRRGLWQRLFRRIASTGTIPAELALDSSHVKAHRSASGGKGANGARRSAAGTVAARRRSVAWPMIGADRLPSP